MYRPAPQYLGLALSWYTSLALSVSSARCCTSHHRSPCPFPGHDTSDTAGALRALLANARVPDILAEHILGLGFQDTADFAYAYSDISDLNTLLNEVPAEIWSALEVADHAHSIPAARIRKAFEIARAASSQETHAHTLSQPSGPPDAETHASPAIAWAEHLPPKLTLQDPGMPSIRLLSMVYEMTKSKRFKWIPWQLRLSARQYQEAVEARSHKAARTETQLLAHAFFDDTHEISVEGKALTTGWLHRIQQVFRNALALCQAVHLLNAKALDQQIANMCLLQPDPALSLRTVTTSELLHADRQIWGTIVDLLQRKWSMDDAFHGRMEIHSLLMLRPRTSRQPLAAPPAKRPTNPARSGKRPAPKPPKAEPPRKKEKRVKGKERGRHATIGRQRVKASQSAADSNRASAKQTTASSRMYAP